MTDAAPSFATDGVDVLVIGGGINGTAIARDAALRGLRVLLVERGDLGEQTSAYNSRLIHGGLRYLEHYEVRLVRESLRERELLLRLAPHLVRPYPLLIPFYEHNTRGAGLLRLGMAAYDALSFDKTTPRHRVLSAPDLARDYPGLAPHGLRGGAVYHDAQVTWPERLCVENAVAAGQLGAGIATHTRAERMLRVGRRVVGATCRDLVTGRQYEVRATATINATGPWIDQLAGEVTETRLIGGTRGSHLVVDPFPGAPHTGVHYEAASDGRAILVLPWAGRYLIGTTDHYLDADPGTVTASGQEIDYLLTETNQLIPSARLGPTDVLLSYSGVRPLPYSPVAGAEGNVTRAHVIHDHGPDAQGLLSIIGGKLTTHRALAEQTVDAVLSRLGHPARERRRLTRGRNPTRRVPLPGGRTRDWASFRAQFTTESGLPATTARRLLDLYGTRASDVLRLAAQRPELAAEFAPRAAPGVLGAELVFAVEREYAADVSDVLLRRTMLGLRPGVALDVVQDAATLLARHTTRGERGELTPAEQVERYRAAVRRLRPRGGVAEPARADGARP